MRQRKATMAVMIFMAAILSGGAWAAGVINSITPNNGPLAGGTAVTIRGSGFTGAASVTFVGVGNGGAFVVVSDAKITCTSPVAATAGAVNVTVNNGANTVTATNGFQYTNATLTVNVVAQINSIIDIAWGGGTSNDSANVAHPLGNVANYLWDVAGVPGGGPPANGASANSTYILSQDFTVNIANQASGITAKISAYVNAGTTTPTAPATTSWTLKPVPGAALTTDQYSLQAKIGAGANQDLNGQTASPGVTLGTIAPNGTAQLDLTYMTPPSTTDTSADGPQTTVVNLLAVKN